MESNKRIACVCFMVVNFCRVLRHLPSNTYVCFVETFYLEERLLNQRSLQRQALLHVISKGVLLVRDQYPDVRWHWSMLCHWSVPTAPLKSQSIFHSLFHTGSSRYLNCNSWH